MSKTRLLICDVCDTLFHSNTTFDFLRFVIARKRLDKRVLFHTINSKRSPLFWALEIVSIISKKDISKQVSLLFLRGMPAEEAQQLANLFYDDFLASRKVHSVFNLLEKERDTSEIMLASSSIDIIVKIIAERNKLSYIASPLEIKNGILTGRLLSDLKSGKHLAITPFLRSQKLVVVTDNRSDWDLVKLAAERFIIVKDHNEKLFWKELDPTFIYR
jgi:phosphoserine phosphatase